MHPLFNNIILKIKSQIEEIKSSAKQQNNADRKTIQQIYMDVFPNALKASFFKSPLIISSSVLSLIYVNKHLYVKPKGILVGGDIDLSQSSELLHNALNELFNVMKPKGSFGKKPITTKQSIELVGTLIMQFDPRVIERIQYFRLK